MDECGDLLCRLQSQKGGEDTRRSRDVADPKTQSTDLDTLTADEPWDQRDPGSLERLSLPQFRVGFLIITIGISTFRFHPNSFI